MCGCSLLKELFQAGIGCGVAKRILKQAFIRLGSVFKVCRTCVCVCVCVCALCLQQEAGRRNIGHGE